jgi:hypothetical protein
MVSMTLMALLWVVEGGAKKRVEKHVEKHVEKRVKDEGSVEEKHVEDVVA